MAADAISAISPFQLLCQTHIKPGMNKVAMTLNGRAVVVRVRVRVRVRVGVRVGVRVLVMVSSMFQ